MRINLPKDLESSIQAEVLTGHFASADALVAEIVREYLGRRRQGQPSAGPQPPGAGQVRKPIWEVFEEITASIPDEEWAKLPVDGAEQHDHYIYGTPRRPAS